MAEENMPPDRRRLEEHIKAPRFLAGEEEGRWKILGQEFPHIYMRVTGIDFESGHTVSLDFHLTCENYPDTAPFVERWDFEAGAKPPAPSVGHPGFIDALKDWSPGGGIYRAWQRHAAVHNNWAQLRPEESWHRNRSFFFIMEQLYVLVSQQAAWAATRQKA
jgi:hypothetical protein